MRQALLLAIVAVLCCSGWAADTGELRLKVTGPGGEGTKCQVVLLNGAKDLRRESETAEDGTLTVRGLPKGRYRLEVSARGLEEHAEGLEIESGIPVRRQIRLSVATIRETVEVRGKDDELIDRESGGPVGANG